MKSLMLLSLSLLAAVVEGQYQRNNGIYDLNPGQFKFGLDQDYFDVVVDVRTESEWEAGHIEGSYHVETTQLPDALLDCKGCTVAAYCRSGARAGAALQKMRAAGFTGRLYNGQGISKWTGAGYGLSKTSPSVEPACVRVQQPGNIGGSCNRRRRLLFHEDEIELVEEESEEERRDHHQQQQHLRRPTANSN